ncbi:hypothetical protein PGT21_021763 [Puccinia graminis f. sp. tritici]|uniref:Uncharacterized protein n=1 Tax=Puccinia graminis f. sp. tritici TaxID=56615 RepID=A0A5B0M404_PUCGR|nr:hypothetical protein PGT21_021763 [Puccinia graminis f. sp. tritici]
MISSKDSGTIPFCPSSVCQQQPSPRICLSKSILKLVQKRYGSVCNFSGPDGPRKLSNESCQPPRRAESLETTSIFESALLLITIQIPKRQTRSNSFDSSSYSSEPEFSAAKTSYRYGRSRKISGASCTSQLSDFSVRCLLQKVPPSSSFFSILAHTASGVSNFNPPVQHDASARPGTYIKFFCTVAFLNQNF